MNTGDTVPSARWIAKKKDRIPMPLRTVEKQPKTVSNNDGRDEESTTPSDLKAPSGNNRTCKIRQARVSGSSQPDDSFNNHIYRDTGRIYENTHQNGSSLRHDSNYHQNQYQKSNNSHQFPHETRGDTRSDSYRYSRNPSLNGEKYDGSDQDYNCVNEQPGRRLPDYGDDRSRLSSWQSITRPNSNDASLRHDSNDHQNHYQNDDHSSQYPTESRGSTHFDSNRYSGNPSPNREKYNGSLQDYTRVNGPQERRLPDYGDDRSRLSTWQDTTRTISKDAPLRHDSNYHQNHYQNDNTSRQCPPESRGGTRSDIQRYSRNSFSNGEKRNDYCQDYSRDNRQQERRFSDHAEDLSKFSSWQDTTRINSNDAPLRHDSNYHQSYYQHDNSFRQFPPECRGGTCTDSSCYSLNSSPNRETYNRSRQDYTRDSRQQERRFPDYADDRSRPTQPNSKPETSDSHQQPTGPTSRISYDRQNVQFNFGNWQKWNTPNQDGFHDDRSSCNRTSSSTRPEMSGLNHQQIGPTSCVSYERRAGKSNDFNWEKSTTSNQHGYYRDSSGSWKPLQQSGPPIPEIYRVKRHPGDEAFEGQVQTIQGDALLAYEIACGRPVSSWRSRDRSHSPPWGIEIAMELEALEAAEAAEAIKAAKASEAFVKDHTTKSSQQCSTATKTNLDENEMNLTNSKSSKANTYTLDSNETCVYDRLSLISMRKLSVSQSIRISEIEKSLGDLGKSQPRIVVPRKPKEEQPSKTAPMNASKEPVRKNAAPNQDDKIIKKDCVSITSESKPVEPKSELSSNEDITNPSASSSSVSPDREPILAVVPIAQEIEYQNISDDDSENDI